jgi:plastocyanin
MLWIMLAAVAALVADVAAASAGTLEGRVVVPDRAPTITPANPYPGRAGSRPAANRGTAGRPEDAVVYLDHLPPEADRAIAATRKVGPRLSQQGQAFQPRVLAIAVGTSVEFPNRDPIYHNVFSLSPAKRFDLGKYPRGHSRSVTFARTGLVNVFCDIHSDMTGFILVLPHHGFARPDGDGAYSLPNVPAGRYVVRAWHPEFATLERTVEVPASGSATVDFPFAVGAPALRADDF